MAPNGDAKIPGSWPDLKKLLTEGDKDRLACLAVAHINFGSNDSNILQAAADMFGGNIRPASYKRALWVITTKLNGGDAGNSAKKASAKKPKTPKSKSGMKRKNTSEGEDEEPTASDSQEQDPTPSKKARTNKIKEENADEEFSFT